MKKCLTLIISVFITVIPLLAQVFQNGKPPRVHISNGTLEGTYSSGISIFKGVPFAAPPVGKLRWREPQPVQNWPGIRTATQFGPRAMQLPLFSDMQFRSNGMSEDCLYLNIWTPAKTGHEKLPVLVYFYGGGFMAGDGSEYRYDGESMARQGIVSITVNYRLNVFGFMAHPALTRESPHHASGNYGLLDQAAALAWVSKNIEAFGGDPGKVTIAGESAGSFSVSAQMASPLSKKLIAGAIGESGSVLGIDVVNLQKAEEAGESFGKSLGADQLDALRAMPAEKLLEATRNAGFGRFPVVVDGYFFPKPPLEIYRAGEQADIPLLYGWNTQEGSYSGILRGKEPSLENFTTGIQSIYGKNAAGILSVYTAANSEQVKQVATDLASDQFIGYGTWKWGELHGASGDHPVYRYLFGRPRPARRADTSGHPSLADGAVHSAEIEYAMGNLPSNRVYNWQPEDYKISHIMQGYFVQFIKTGNPNGLGLPFWPAAKHAVASDYLYIDTETKPVPELHRDRYLLLDKIGNGR